MIAAEMGAAVSGPHFDESLGAADRGLYLAPIACGAVLTAGLRFAWLERRGRSG